MIRAKYTVVLKSLMDNEQTRQALEDAMSSYKLYTPTHPELYGYIPTREELNRKILNHYKYREIGFETVGRFLDELETSLCEIMPYYNMFYKSVDVMNGIEDIFANVDVTETFEQDSEGSSKGSSEVSSEGSSEDNTTGSTTNTANSTASSNTETNSNVDGYNKTVSSQTPQGNISLANTGIEEVTYADNISWNHNSSNDTANTSGTDTTESSSSQTTTGKLTNTKSEDVTSNTLSETLNKITHTLNKKGNQGVNTYAHDMLEFRNLFVNIEQMIINDERISELFMRIY